MTSRPRATRAWLTNAGLAALALASFLLGPRLMDGFTALQWVRYHAARGGEGREAPGHLRGAALHAVRALELLAPLPWAGEAAGLALDLGRRLEGQHDDAVLSLYTEIRSGLDRVRGSAWRGLGLAGLAGEAARLEQAARARAVATAR